MDYLIDRAINQISSIDWDNNCYRESHGILIYEFLRRTSLFIHSQSLKDVYYPIFSASEAINKKPEIDFIEFCPVINKINDIYSRSLCIYFLEWTYLVDDCDNIAVKYKDLYNPIIEFYSRGGKFIIREGELILNNYAYPLKYWKSNYNAIVKDISGSILDRIDRK